LHTAENSPDNIEDSNTPTKRLQLTPKERFIKAVNKVIVLNHTKFAATHKFLDLLD